MMWAKSMWRNVEMKSAAAARRKSKASKSESEMAKAALAAAAAKRRRHQAAGSNQPAENSLRNSAPARCWQRSAGNWPNSGWRQLQ